MQLLSSRLRSEKRRPTSVPSFAAAGFEPLDPPFRDPIEVLGQAPGEACLRTRLTVLGTRAQPVHWEVTRRPQFQAPERYGLLLAQAGEGYRVSVLLTGLEPGRRYWARFWAGGHWSGLVLLRSASHHTPLVASLAPAVKLRPS